MKLFWWLRITGTVIPAIWWQIFILLIYSAGVVCIENFLPFLYQAFPIHLIVILGTVIGLLLVFRTNAAYNRYWEGRELWSKMTQEIRKLTRAIWSGVKEVDAKDVVEKKSALNLCSAFIISTKHYVREEYSYHYVDYEGLLDHLPKFFTPSSNQSLNQQGRDEVKGQKKKVPEAFDHVTPTNIPVEISYYLVSYIKYLEENQLAHGWALTSMQDSISNLVDCIAGFERILRTPMPLAYSVHLQECVWLFLLSIPFQTIGDVGPWFTIPIVGIAAFVYLGILAIGFEIENPLGYDANDFPLDDFCNVMLLEIQKVLVTDAPVAQDWLYSSENRPFGPMCSLSALQLSELPLLEAKGILKSVSQTYIISTEEENKLKQRADSHLHLAGLQRKSATPKNYQSI